MGYSDQKFYSRETYMAADSTVATGTITASGTNNVATAFPIPTEPTPRVIVGIRAVVKTAPATNLTNVNLNFLQGTTTFGVVTISTLTAGQQATGTFTNTASTAVTTQTVTASNGAVTTNTITSTTDWRRVGTNSAVTVTVNGTGTASAQSYGAFELWFDEQLLFS